MEAIKGIGFFVKMQANKNGISYIYRFGKKLVALKAFYGLIKNGVPNEHS